MCGKGLNQTISNIRIANSAPIRAITPIALTIRPTINLAASYAASPTIGLVYARPIYSNPYR